MNLTTIEFMSDAFLLTMPTDVKLACASWIWMISLRCPYSRPSRDVYPSRPAEPCHTIWQGCYWDHRPGPLMDANGRIPTATIHDYCSVPVDASVRGLALPWPCNSREFSIDSSIQLVIICWHVQCTDRGNSSVYIHMDRRLPSAKLLIRPPMLTRDYRML